MFKPEIPDFFIKTLPIREWNCTEESTDNRATTSLSHLPLWRLQLISGNDVDEKVKLIKLCNRHGNVIPLEQQKENHSSALEVGFVIE